MNYAGNNPKRRIAPLGRFTQAELHRLAASARYVGSALHKSKPADYGFHPQTNPRPSKSLCDKIRVVPLSEARQLLRSGFADGLISTHFRGSLPKYVWAVDADGEVYESKLGADGRSYHGYRLNHDDKAMREWVIKEWKRRKD